MKFWIIDYLAELSGFFWKVITYLICYLLMEQGYRNFIRICCHISADSTWPYCQKYGQEIIFIHKEKYFSLHQVIFSNLIVDLFSDELTLDESDRLQMWRNIPLKWLLPFPISSKEKVEKRKWLPGQDQDYFLKDLKIFHNSIQSAHQFKGQKMTS